MWKAARQALSLAWVGFISFHNADAMVRELVVAARQFNLRHVTGDALASRYRARFRSGLSALMACLTLSVVIDGPGVHFLVRIMAGHAANALIIRVIAFTAGQSIGLEANVRDTRVSLHCNVRPGPVALAAEVGCLLGRER